MPEYCSALAVLLCGRDRLSFSVQRLLYHCRFTLFHTLGYRYLLANLDIIASIQIPFHLQLKVKSLLDSLNDTSVKG